MSEYIYGSSLRAAKSNANYLFTGDFRRRPNQNLSGASRSVARVELIQQAAQQRQTREDIRRKENAALKIQALFRGYRSRKAVGAELAKKFDTSIAEVQQNRTSLAPQQIALLIRELVVFYHSNRDEIRLYHLINLMIDLKDATLDFKRKDPGLWGYGICRLLTMCLGTIRKRSSSDFQQLSTYLEFFEVFTRPGDVLSEFEAFHMWTKIIGSSFFPTMRTLYDRNIHVELSLELIRRSLDTDPMQTNPCDIKPAYRFFEQYLREPLQPELENLVFTNLIKSKPRQLEPNVIVEAFSNSKSYNNRNPFPSHTATNFGINQSHMQNIQETKETIRLCYLLIKSLNNRLDSLDDLEKVCYINLISTMIEPAEYITNISMIQVEDNENSAPKEEDDEPIDLILNSTSRIHQLTNYHTEIHNVISKIIELINQLPHINSLRTIIFNGSLQNQVQEAIVKICNLMLTHEPLAIFNCRLLYTVAFSKEFSRSLWRSIVTATSPSIYMSSTPINVQIARGSQSISQASWKAILPKLKLFCSLCSYLLPTLNDEEFYTENQMYSLTQDEQPKPSNSSNTDDGQTSGSEVNSSISTFYVDKELVGISAILRDMAVGLVEIIYHRNLQMVDLSSSPKKLENIGEVLATGPMGSQTDDESTKLLSFEIKSSFQALVRILCQLHARDSWKRFCPKGHWLCPAINIPSNKSIDFQLATIQQGRLLNQIGRNHLNAERQLNVSCEIKTVLILQEIPFVISFHDRVQIFHQLLKKDRQLHHSARYNFGLPGGSISVKVRRNYIYEDAFEKLSFDKEPNMKQPLRVSMINEIGLDEAGVDGGGLSKEFLSELLKAGFDPMRGFFKCTTDNFLYPNPSANVLFANLSEGLEVHYEFLGRMLGKAMFEKIMVELPFASFFLAKLLAAQHSSDVDLHNLESLDPVLYKNLVYLKNYKGDVADLDLDFTISNNDLDEHEVIELKPGGSKIAVTRENKIEYVHLIADYRLNKQIRLQCAAFKRGLEQLIDLKWLRMFDSRELQILISGAPTIIDVNDWRQHTHYCNGYSDKSPAIVAFWAAVRRMNESSKRKLLKFATSVSLPPLLGFKDLNPSFAIAPSDEERLPTSSTCMNLLKLPQIEDEETMRSKLLYAIESNSGFELS